MAHHTSPPLLWQVEDDPSAREIRQASDQGRLAFGYVEELFDTGEEVYTLEEASRQTGLEPALIERVVAALGAVPAQSERISADVDRLKKSSKHLAPRNVGGQMISGVNQLDCKSCHSSPGGSWPVFRAIRRRFAAWCSPRRSPPSE